MSEEVSRTADSTGLFARMIRTLQERRQLLPLDRSAVARVDRIRRAAHGRQRKTSLHRGRLGDLLSESDFRARTSGASVITGEHITGAALAALRRLDQFREKSHEGILRDIMLVATSGSAVGQVNGLAVYLLGDYAFGRPTRITATARLGAAARCWTSSARWTWAARSTQGGHDHHRAAGRSLRPQSSPALTASLVFEQSYGGIEGDSASVAELVALISAIADIPCARTWPLPAPSTSTARYRRSAASTRSEGFFDICSSGD